MLSPGPQKPLPTIASSAGSCMLSSVPASRTGPTAKDLINRTHRASLRSSASRAALPTSLAFLNGSSGVAGLSTPAPMSHTPLYGSTVRARCVPLCRCWWPRERAWAGPLWHGSASHTCSACTQPHAQGRCRCMVGNRSSWAQLWASRLQPSYTNPPVLELCRHEAGGHANLLEGNEGPAHGMGVCSTGGRATTWLRLQRPILSFVFRSLPGAACKSLSKQRSRLRDPHLPLPAACTAEQLHPGPTITLEVRYTTPAGQEHWVVRVVCGAPEGRGRPGLVHIHPEAPALACMGSQKEVRCLCGP